MGNLLLLLFEGWFDYGYGAALVNLFNGITMAGAFELTYSVA